MRIHLILILVLTAVFLLRKKIEKVIPVFSDPVLQRRFFLAALLGNAVGIAITAAGGREERPVSEVVLEKGDRIYEEEYRVFTRDGSFDLTVEVPMRESDAEEAEEEETETDPRTLLKERIIEYNREKDDPDHFYLPGVWKGETLEWGKKRDTTGNFLAVLSLLGGILLFPAEKSRENEVWKKRQEQLLYDYPGFIMEFTMLIEAGENIRGALERMGEDYRKRRLLQKKEDKREAYEQLLITLNEMDSGVTEAEAYAGFAKRCAHIKYKTFAALLIQNRQRGTRSLTELLERESFEAWEERKRKARILAEKAASGLVVPMILMMIVVMAIILLPAFMHM